MLLKKSKFSINIPLSLKVSVWYGTFIALLLAFIVGGSFFAIDEFSDSVSKKSLVENVNSRVYYDIEDSRDAFEEGVHYAEYDLETGQIKGMLPRGFPNNIQNSNNQVSEIEVGERVFYYYDVQIPGEDDKFLRGVTEVSKIKEVLYYFPILLMIISPFVLFLVIYVGYLILKKSLSPIRSMTDTADEISRSSDLSKRIAIPNTKDEVEVLAKTFNNMLISLETSSEREKRFSSDVSHELRTPVSVIRAEAEYASKYADSLEESKQSLEVIDRQSKRMTDMINQILEISRLDTKSSVEKEEVNLSEMLTNIAKDYTSLIEKNNLKLNTDLGQDIKLNANHDLMHRLIDNILLNAIKFADENIKINLSKENSNIRISVIDDGPGIPDEYKEKVWERFYKVDQSRTRTENQSSGLGLSISKKIAELHNGSITIKDNNPKGTIMDIVFKVQE
ncbi:MAG: HAMP domain-containing sensor histidine kinase [Gemella sp.]|nr:HAMP domain-containing sensor histidine kinase [Gemella sp.]